MGIIVRQRPDLTAYEEGEIDGQMLVKVLRGRCYPHVRDGVVVSSTLCDAIEAQRRHTQEFLLEGEADPEDSAYLQGKLNVLLQEG